MLESVGALTGSPWIYAVVALSVLFDVFLPLLPSGVLVITAATAAAAAGSGTGRVPHDVPDILLLMLCAATASVLGDLVAVARNASSLELTCFASSVLVNGAVTATSNTKPAAICPHSGHARYLRHARAGSPGPSDAGSAP